MKEEKIKAGERFIPEHREWEQLKPEPFISVEEKYVICIDTLG